MSLTYRYNSQQLGDLTEGFPTGGYPMFHKDVYNLANMALLQGVFTEWREWNVILSGCYIDELNLTTQTVKVTSGYMMIDEKVYFFEGYNGTYPFEVIPSSQVEDEREFKDSGIHTVGINYDYTINTTFTYDSLQDDFPDHIANAAVYKGIFFDPFTDQRSEFVRRRQGMVTGDMRQYNRDISFFDITTTETGKNIIYTGSPLRFWSSRSFARPNLRYALAGFYATNDFVGKFIVGLDAGTARTGGVNSHTLGTNNIPTHTHAKGDLSMSLVDGNRKINVDSSDVIGGFNSVKGGSMASSATTQTILENSIILPRTTHQHTITGVTEDGTLQGLKASPDSLDNRPEFRGVIMLEASKWNYKFNSRPIVESNACWF